MIRFSSSLLAFGLGLWISGCTTLSFGEGEGDPADCVIGTQDCLCDLQGECQVGLVCERDICVPAPTKKAVPTGADSTEEEQGPDEDASGSNAGVSTPEGATSASETAPTTDQESSTSSSSSTSTSETTSSAGPSCDDGILNAKETDKDCGGGTCPACQNGLRCLVNEDCVSSSCEDGVCKEKNAIPCNRDLDCRDGNVCTQDRCVNKRCEITPRPDGTDCNDSELCTIQDQCNAGRCVGKDTRVLEEDFSDPNNVAFELDFAPPQRMWQVAEARVSSCNTVPRLGEDPAQDHTQDAANGVLGVAVGGCSEDQNMKDLDCAWTRYVDVSFFDKDLHFSFWRYISTPGIEGRRGQLKVRNFQYFRIQGDGTPRLIKTGWDNRVRDRRWAYDDAVIERHRIGGPISIGICYQRIEGQGAFAGWSVDDVKIRQVGCQPKG